jgi:polygalacturonase
MKPNSLIRRISLSTIATLVSVTFATAQITQQTVDERLQRLPFPSFSVNLPVFPDKTFAITDFGAKGDAITDCTKAINDAIAKCSSEGGGKVTVPPGIYLTGQIIMKNKVNLHLEAGSTVLFTPDISVYPLVKNGGGFAIDAQLNGSNVEDAAITGEGCIDGNGQYWRPVKKDKTTDRQWKSLLAKGGVINDKGTMWFPDEGAAQGQAYLSGRKKSELNQSDYEKVKTFLRPKMLTFTKGKNILIEGVTLKNSPSFAMMLRDITGLVISNVTVMNEWWAQNGDGLDISGCKNVLFDRCTVNAGDDGICMKSSNNRDGGFNLENIVIRDCKVYHAHGGFVIGSNTDGKIRNIYVSNCTFTWTDTGLRFKSNAGRGGLVENVFIDGIYMKDIDGEAIIFDLQYEDGAAVKNIDYSNPATLVPDFRNITISNVICDGAKTAFLVDGNNVPMVSGIKIDHSVFKTEKGIDATLANGLVFSNTRFITTKKPAVTLNQVSGATLENCLFGETSGTILQVSGTSTKEISIVNTNIHPAQIKATEGASPESIKIR